VVRLHVGWRHTPADINLTLPAGQVQSFVHPASAALVISRVDRADVVERRVRVQEEQRNRDT
jgi:hypothetical protein